MLGRIGLRSILLWIIALMGLMGMLFALATGEVYSRITLDNHRNTLSELTQLKSTDLIKDLESAASDLGMALQSDQEFNKAFDSGNRKQLESQLNRQFHQYFVTAGALKLELLRVYDKNYMQIGSSSEIADNLNSVPDVDCSGLLELAAKRTGTARLRIISDFCLGKDSVAHSVIVPIGGLRIKGYLEVLSDPIEALRPIEQALGMSLRIALPDDTTVYRSSGWIGDEQKNGGPLSRYILRDRSDRPALHIIIQDDMQPLEKRLLSTRYSVMFTASLATLMAILLVLGLLHGAALRPLDYLTRHLRKVQEDRSHLGEPVELRGTSEIRELMLDFNEMTAELKELYQTLEHMAFTDSLTRLPNRSRFHERLQVATAVGRRHHSPFALLLMDLDRFKGVNDTLGHHAGDHLLKMVSDRLQNVLRSDDAFTHLGSAKPAHGDDDIIARLGGDEFAAILSSVSSRHDAALVARKLLECMEPPFVVEGHQFNIGISIGIVLYPEHGLDPSALMRHADVAMYNAKNTQRGYAFYDSGQDSHSLQKLMLEHELRSAFHHQTLDVYYQPKIDLSRGVICGAEALLRWPHPTRGFIPPDQFIPEAERSGLIQPMTYWVLNQALQECARWNRTGVSINVSINISAIMLREPRFSLEIANALKGAGLPPENLILELTESTIMSDPDYAMRILSDLDRMGVQLSIDDFGTGYSSLSYLRRLPVDEVKIDKSFVIDMQNNAHDAVIVRSTIDLAHNMGLSVVAEGVESHDAFKRLAEWRCDMVQGYYLGHPIPSDQFFALITQHGYKSSIATA